MARGTKTFEFEFLLMDAIPIMVLAYARGGKVYHIEPSYQGQRLNIEEHLYDEENDFITLKDYFIYVAQGIIDMPVEDELEVAFIPEFE